MSYMYVVSLHSPPGSNTEYPQQILVPFSNRTLRPQATEVTGVEVTRADMSSGPI